MMNELTKHYKVLDEHVVWKRGQKSVCVSTCLNFLGIRPDQYQYTSSKTSRVAYENVLRKFGFAVKNVDSKIGKQKRGIYTTTEISRLLRKSDFGPRDYFLVVGDQNHNAHLILMNGNGEKKIDTSPRSRWRVWYPVKHVYKK